MPHDPYAIAGRAERHAPFVLLTELWSHAAAAAPDRTAIADDRVELTYREVFSQARRLAGDLVRRGCAGRTVAIVLANGADFHRAYLAALLARATPALVNPAYPPAQIAQLLEIAAPRLILTCGTPELAASAVGCLVLDAELWAGLPDPDPLPAIRPDDPAALLFTGGTTGLPKGVVHSHAAMANAVRAMDYVWPTRFAAEVWLPVAPMSHIYGLLMGVLNPVHAAARIVVPPRFQPDLIVSTLEAECVTVFGGGPGTVYTALLAAPNLRDADLSALAVCPAGGAPVSVAVLERWRRAVGTPINEAYGMTELAPITGSGDHIGQKDGSVGRALPLNGVEIVDLETGTQKLAPGETGEIRVRGPSAMTGYLNQPEESGQTLRDGWIHTGDLGHLDKDGFLFVTDRKKDMVLVKGFNVFPRVIEEALLSHPAVQAACIVGVPDERSGERLAAFVVLAGETPVEELRDHLAARLAGYMVPASFTRLEALPATAAGKPDRQALRRIAAA